MRLKFLFLFCFVCGNSLFSQSDTNLGFLPKIIVTNNFSDKVNWINSIETRSILYDEETQFSYNLFDYRTIYSQKINKEQSYSLGYVLRFEGKTIIHRTFQNFKFKSSFLNLDLGHRFVLEQFYQPEKTTRHRARYGFSYKQPIFKKTKDNLFLKLGHEYLYDFKADDLEMRITSYLSCRPTQKDVLDLGVDYRVGNFIYNFPKNQFWLRVTWHKTL